MFPKSQIVVVSMGGWTEMGGIEAVVKGGRTDEEFVGPFDVG